MNAPIVTLPATIEMPTLAAGERWGGVVIPEDGAAPYHLVLLGADAGTLMTWKQAKAWAESLGDGAAPPTRKEQALLFANASDAFKRDWYWSGEQHAEDESYAWCQLFGYGYQDYRDASDELRARAVRRSPIQSFASLAVQS